MIHCVVNNTIYPRYIDILVLSIYRYISKMVIIATGAVALMVLVVKVVISTDSFDFLQLCTIQICGINS